jgi:hypothetical protein
MTESDDTQRGMIDLLYGETLLDWRSFVRYNGPNTERVFVIHFPNDGFFYVEKNLSDPDVNESDVANYRHQQNCYDGWFLLGDSDWQDLAPISAFMEAWLSSTNIEKKMLPHSTGLL